MASFTRVPEDRSGRRAEQAQVQLTLAAKMKQNVATGVRRRHLFRKYTDCFTGMEAVDWMLEQMEAKSVAEAVRKGQALFMARLIEKVDRERQFEYSRKRFYRFTAATPELVHAVARPLPNASLDIPLSAPARRRALAALLGAFVADAASTSLNGMTKPEKTIPNLLRADFDPAFCGTRDSNAMHFFSKSSSSSSFSGVLNGRGAVVVDGGDHMDSSTGYEARVILQAIASRGRINGAQLAKDAYWGLKNNKRMLSSSARAFTKRIEQGRTWPHCAVPCRSIDVLSLVPLVVALYAGTEELFAKMDEVASVFYSGQRVRDTALVAAFILEQVILGASVLQAMRTSIRTERLTVRQRKVIFKAFTKSELPSYEAIQRFGNKGALPGGFLAVLQPLFVLNDYATAVRENIIGGGRTCRRAMFLGACFAAQDGLDAIPEDWVKKTPYFDYIETDSATLIARRELQGTFMEDAAATPLDGGDLRVSRSSSQHSQGSVASHMRRDSSLHQQTPYVDYVAAEPVLTASALHRAQAAYESQSQTQTPTQTPAQAPSVRSHQTYQSQHQSQYQRQNLSRSQRQSQNQPQRHGNGRQRSSSIDSASPRSQASHYSYASGTTNGSSTSSVADFGDMSQFYSSKASPESAQVGDDMMQFYEQNYVHNKPSSASKLSASTASTSSRSSSFRRPSGSGNGVGMHGFQRSSVSTARSSGSNQFSMSGRLTGSRGSEHTTFFQSGLGMRMSDLSSSVGPSTTAKKAPPPFYSSPFAVSQGVDDPAEGDEEGDVMFAPRQSLSVGHEQRVSLHAIL